MSLTVITNHVPRLVIDAYELSAAERADFDYLDWTAIDRGEDSATFFRYKGRVYDLGEFLACPESLAQWDGYTSDSFFSGVVVNVSRDGDHVTVGRYYS